jgi:hypothetical protein
MDKVNYYPLVLYPDIITGSIISRLFDIPAKRLTVSAETTDICDLTFLAREGTVFETGHFSLLVGF